MGNQTNWRNRIIETRTVNARELTPHPMNWRRHPDKQAGALRGLLAEVGIVAPLIAYESARYGGLTLIDGHMRQEAGGEWPVTVLDVTDEEADLILATFDPISGLAEMDATALAALLGSVEMTPVEDAGVQALLAELAVQTGASAEEPIAVDAEPQIDRAEELRAKWGVESGQLWQLGDHRLICGDCTDAAVVARVMGGERAQMVFTDPPYGVSIGAKNRLLNSVQPSGRNLADIKDDDLSPSDLKALLLPAFTNIRKHVMADDCTVFVTAPQGGELGMMMMMMMSEAGLPVRHVLIWKKNQPTFSMGRLDYDYQHEPILLTWGKRHKRPMLGRHRTSIWEIDKPRASADHPTMKPVELVVNALMNNSDMGDIVFDAYLGSGTTVLAGESTNRRARAVEISPAYVAVAIQRWHVATGKEPVLLEAS